MRSKSRLRRAVLRAAGLVLPFVLWAAAPEISAQAEEPQRAEDPEPEPDDVRAFLEAAWSHYELPFLHGLESFDVEIRISSVASERMERLRDGVVITYAWEAPDIEEIEFEGLPAQFRKPIRDPLRGIWKDIAGGCVFSDIDPDMEDGSLTLSGTDEGISLASTPPDGVSRTVLFDPETKLVLKEDVSGENLKAEIIPTYSDVDGILRLDSKIVSVSGQEGEIMEGTYVYGGYRNLDGFQLPTILTMNAGSLDVELKLIYISVNGEKPMAAEVDVKKVKALVKDFEKRYSKLSGPEKKDAMKKLAETGHELAAASIAKKGLKDKDLIVREEAAVILGRMECREAAPALIKAMKPNERNLKVYEALIDALGSLGDPRAVDVLSSDLWNQKENITGIRLAKLKIDALGRIRSKKSVEALIDMMHVGGPAAMNRLAGNLTRSLQKLTGQQFGWDRDRWKDWWKKNKSKFKLEEDRR